ncbi:MAG: hypothetical protein Q4C42_09795 [Clostridia bacterium]|nr:hypothetical protein [Clostridia bacterium]
MEREIEIVATPKWSKTKNCWQLNVQQNGIRKSFYCSKKGRVGKVEVLQKAKEWIKTITNDDGKYIDCKSEELINAYLDYQKKNKKEETYEKMECALRVWLKPAIGEKMMSKICDGDIQAILDSMCAEGRSRKTISNYRNYFSQFFVWCRGSGTHIMRCMMSRFPMRHERRARRYFSPSICRSSFASTPLKTEEKSNSTQTSMLTDSQYSQGSDRVNSGHFAGRTLPVAP